MSFNAREFYYPFSWKKPLIYVVICVSIFIYVYIFFINKESVSFGLMSISYETTISFLVFFVSLLFHLFRNSEFIRQVNSIFLRGLLLFGFIALIIVLTIHARVFREYDDKEMNTYIRVLPFSNSLTFRSRETVVFSNIVSIRNRPGGEGTRTFIFYLENGATHGMTPSQIQRRARDYFFVNLTANYERLTADVERASGPIAAMKERLEENRYMTRIDISHLVFMLSFIWMILVQSICLIIYTFKITVGLPLEETQKGDPNYIKIQKGGWEPDDNLG